MMFGFDGSMSDEHWFDHVYVWNRRSYLKHDKSCDFCALLHAWIMN